MTTATYTNRKTGEQVQVVMDGMSCSWHRHGETCVRPTACGRFAVIADKGDRLIKTFDDRMHARRYNFAIHGDNLGE